MIRYSLRFTLGLLILCQSGCQETAPITNTARLEQATLQAANLGKANSRFAQLSITQLQSRITEIDEQLEFLSPISLRTGVGAVGGRSAIGSEQKRSEWFLIELDQTVPIDQVVLVPTIWRDSKMGLRADGFPLEFQIVIGTKGDNEGTVVASISSERDLLPRIAPLVVSFRSTVGYWVRIEATVLSSRLWDSQYAFQLSEILIFSGEENVALKRPVKASSKQAFQTNYLADGFVPYLMDAKDGDQSIAFFKQGGISSPPELTFDLGKSQPLNRIQLHTVELSDTIPQSNKDGHGVPRHLLVEGANKADFSDAVELIELRLGNVYDFGPVIMRRFPETSCRYVRLIAMAPDQLFRSDTVIARIGFAEIELFADGENVALGADVQANFLADDPRRPLSALTDGENFYGKILPIRQWINELALRHDLETERPIVVAELNRQYSVQSSRLYWVSWLAAVLTLGIGAIFVGDRVVRKRELEKMKLRFAADLHDELGANLHVIGMLGDLAQASANSPEKLEVIHQRIREMTERSGAAVRYCTNILDAEGLYQDLYEDMKRTTERIMADIHGELSFNGNPDDLKRLKPRKRADLFLFYKECLVNISRHSEATEFSAQLSAADTEVSLTVSDNGNGLAKPFDHRIPPSLLRRARLLGARVNAKNLEGGGACVTLNFRTRLKT